MGRLRSDRAAGENSGFGRGILGGFIGLVLWTFYIAIILLFGGMLADIVDRGGRPQKSRT